MLPPDATPRKRPPEAIENRAVRIGLPQPLPVFPPQRIAHLLGHALEVWHEGGARRPVCQRIRVFEHVRVYLLEDGDVGAAALEEEFGILVYPEHRKDALPASQRGPVRLLARQLIDQA